MCKYTFLYVNFVNRLQLVVTNFQILVENQFIRSNFVIRLYISVSEALLVILTLISSAIARELQGTL